MDDETRASFETLGGEFADLRGGLADLRQSVDRKFDLLAAEIRKNGVLTEDLRSRVALLTEKVDLNNVALDRLRAEVDRDMNAGFSTMHAAFAEVRSAIDDLRTRR